MGTLLVRGARARPGPARARAAGTDQRRASSATATPGGIGPRETATDSPTRITPVVKGTTRIPNQVL